jgi:hemolysin III
MKSNTINIDHLTMDHYKDKNIHEVEEWARGWTLGDEWANAYTHGLGLLLSLLGFFFLVFPNLDNEDPWKLFSFTIYGISLVLLYSASTIYHVSKTPKLKKLFRKVDHCAIYLLIAGSYTPFTLMPLKGMYGWMLFGTIWSLAFLGIFLKSFFIHRFLKFSTFLYLLMGWLVIIAAEPLVNNFPYEGLIWLFVGGLSYTCGVIFFVMDKRKFYHAIWHLFVLGGSACQYFAILFYI